MSRCDSCDPSFGCFSGEDAASRCRKYPSAMTPEGLQPEIKVLIQSRTHDRDLTDAMRAESLLTDMVGDVEEFHRKFGLTYDGKPRVLPLELAEFRREFLREEVKEYCDESFAAQQALSGQFYESRERVAFHLENMLDAMIDEIYVCIGTMLLHGFTPAVIREAWRRVQHANMQKERAERASDSKRGTTYDVIKPPGWTPPSHADLVEDHAHREGEP